MKIRDLNINDYVIVYDLGKSEYSGGMTVVGRVTELEYKDIDENEATIESVPFNEYTITDDNYFDLWSNYIESKTESVSDNKKPSVRWIKKVTLVTDEGQHIEIPERIMKDPMTDLIGYVDKQINKTKQSVEARVKAINKNIEDSQKYIHEVKSNDLQQRKRKDEDVGLFKIKDLKVGYKVKVLGEDMTGEVCEIADNCKSAEIRVDDGVYRIINDNYDFTIIEWNAVPQYPDDTVNHPSHYNYGDIEVIDYCDQVCKQYPPELAPYVFNAIKYLSRATHKNGSEDIAKAKYFVQRLFDKWDVK
ncbi:DUF3310 domain-containing protein [Staphylococcus nepalensis]|uniref:DUF3310 domain-containing protein n=1 Tax=Staphylococcus nepalensis TaxID=214473 RepID=UPI0020CEFFB6|nr:DUF3310 domain-containing protein [Staphylococcus nepalensis]